MYYIKKSQLSANGRKLINAKPIIYLMEPRYDENLKILKHGSVKSYLYNFKTKSWKEKPDSSICIVVNHGLSVKEQIFEHFEPAAIKLFTNYLELRKATQISADYTIKLYTDKIPDITPHLQVLQEQHPEYFI
jgi:hypothetical protein